jgi:hypothetical protein
MKDFDPLKPGRPDLERLVADHLDEVKGHARIAGLEADEAVRLYTEIIGMQYKKPHINIRSNYERALKYTHEVIEYKRKK